MSYKEGWKRVHTWSLGTLNFSDLHFGIQIRGMISSSQIPAGAWSWHQPLAGANLDDRWSKWGRYPANCHLASSRSCNLLKSQVYFQSCFFFYRDRQTQFRCPTRNSSPTFHHVTFWIDIPSNNVFVMCALNHDLNEKKRGLLDLPSQIARSCANKETKIILEKECLCCPFILHSVTDLWWIALSVLLNNQRLQLA